MDATKIEAPFERGIYGLTDLTRLVGVRHRHRHTAEQVGRWLEHGLAELDHQKRRPDYSFHDLISLFVVRDLIDAGVRLRDIAQAEEHLRQELNVDRPFASLRVKTDGVDVLYDATPQMDEQLTAANRHGQEVLQPTIEAALRDVHYEHALAARWTPLSAIVVDPSVQFGEPCVAGTRVTTARLAELHTQPERESVARLASTFDLPISHVEQALAFERELAAAA
jgi:uncharacterized protein (DUF433 family)